MGVEVLEDVAVAVVDATVRLVGDDQVEEADVKRLQALHHRRVGGQVDAFVALVGRAGGNEGPKLSRQELLEDVVGLFAQVRGGRTGTGCAWPTWRRMQGVAQGDGHPGLAGAGGLDEERLPLFLGEALDDLLDGLVLVEPVDDARRGGDLGPGLCAR